MSGFFDRLVARQTDVASIRPRVPSRFESDRRAPLSAGRDLHAEGVAPSDSAPTQPAEHGDLERAHVDDRVTSVTVAGAVSDQAFEPAIHADTTPRTATVSFVSPDPRPPVRISAGAADADRNSVSRERLVQPSPRTAQAAAPILDPSSLQTALDEVARSARARAPRDSGVQPTRVTPQVELRRAAPVQPSGPAVVQVHIGRVEVRAVMPAERPRAAQGKTAPRPLPLDRYLSGNGRR